MNLKLVAGIVLFVIGLAAAVGGMFAVGRAEVGDQPSVALNENRSTYLTDRAEHNILPWIAGLSLAVGGALIGLSVGNFKNPRVHLEPGDAVVDPEGYRKMKHV